MLRIYKIICKCTNTRNLIWFYTQYSSIYCFYCREPYFHWKSFLHLPHFGPIPLPTNDTRHLRQLHTFFGCILGLMKVLDSGPVSCALCWSLSLDLGAFASFLSRRLAMQMEEEEELSLCFRPFRLVIPFGLFVDASGCFLWVLNATRNRLRQLKRKKCEKHAENKVENCVDKKKKRKEWINRRLGGGACNQSVWLSRIRREQRTKLCINCGRRRD